MIIRSFDDSDVAGKVMKTATFTASGTWTKPDGVEFVLVDMCGGGASGDGLAANSLNASGGGAGVFFKDKYLETPLSSYAITVASQTYGIAGSYGNSGGVSSFGSLLSASGGSASGGYAGTLTASVTPESIGGQGMDCPGFGAGGGGGCKASTAGRPAGGFGAGGGGAGGSTNYAAAGGAGAPGIVIIKWFE